MGPEPRPPLRKTAWALAAVVSVPWVSLTFLIGFSVYTDVTNAFGSNEGDLGPVYLWLVVPWVVCSGLLLCCYWELADTPAKG